MLIVTNSHVTKLHFESTKISTKSTVTGKDSITQLFVRLFVRDNVCSHAEAQRAQSSHRALCFPQNYTYPADNDFLSRFNGRIFPLFRYFSVSSVIDKDNSHGDWREDIFYNGRNGNYRKRRTSENRVILV